MSDKELKPCPLCESNHLNRFIHYYVGGKVAINMTECLDCRTSGPTDLWNTRPVRDELVAALSQLNNSLSRRALNEIPLHTLSRVDQILLKARSAL